MSSRPFARVRSAFVGVLAAVLVTSTGSAHDFWLIPDMFGFGANSTVHVNGRSGLRFPAGNAVQPTRILEARVIGGNSDVKITEMAVEGTSLRLHQKPEASGQYLVVAATNPPLRATRTVPPNMIRFLRAEGGAAEAVRLEADEAFMKSDSVVYMSRSYAATILQVGSAGPRAFTRSAGYPLEFVPVNDPAHVHVGDTLHVRIMGNGKAVPNIGIDATPAADTTAAAGTQTTNEMVALKADANGVVHLPLTKAGPWMLRSALATPKQGGAPNEFEIARSTYVFNVGTKH